MNVIHVANIGSNRANGVNIVVPEHMKYQSKFSNIGFFNFSGISVPIDSNVKILSKNNNLDFDLREFPEPFNRPDLVIIHDVFSTLKFYKVAKILKKENIPYIIVPHGCFTYNALKRKKIKKLIAINTIFRTLIYKATAIQYLTENERKNSFIQNNYIIIPNGITIPQNVDTRRNYDKVSFVYIGRKDIYHKGIDILLKACKIAKDAMREKDATLTLYGPDRKGSFKKIDKMIQEYKIDDFVFNKEAIFDHEKERVLKSSSVFVLTSRSEGHPVALLEACAYGLPVLITPGTSVSDEVLKYNCGWVSEQTAENIAEKLIYIVNKPEEIQKKSKNAYEYVSNLYSWERVAKLTIEKYKEVINNYDSVH